MKTKILLIVLLISCAASMQAQKLITRNGHISFFSHTAVEDIKADNNQVTSLIDTENGSLVFSMTMKSFQFEKALMQEHFNEKYVESSKFPKATFKGKITNLDDINFSENGEYVAKVKGEMTIHGVTKDTEAEGTITVKDGVANLVATIAVKPEDHDIHIPALVKDQIAKELKVDMDLKYEALK